MPNYLSNTFTLSMLDTSRAYTLRVTPVKREEIPEKLRSIVGHKSTARVLSQALERDVKFNRASFKLRSKDSLYVAKYVGDRPPEKIEELSEVSMMYFFKINVLYQDRKGNYDGHCIKRKATRGSMC